jgi:hypothetical protein
MSPLKGSRRKKDALGVPMQAPAREDRKADSSAGQELLMQAAIELTVSGSSQRHVNRLL